jgi:hypothetical protein
MMGKCNICGREIKVSRLYVGAFHTIRHKASRKYAIWTIVKKSAGLVWTVPVVLFWFAILLITWPVYKFHEWWGELL